MFDPYTWLAAASSIGGLWVLLLFAYRRIPKQPAPDDIEALRHDFYALAETFQDFVEKHDQAMASSYAKVGRLRGKLRKLSEEEGLDPEDVEDEAVHQPAPVIPLGRTARKQAARQALLHKGA